MKSRITFRIMTSIAFVACANMAETQWASQDRNSSFGTGNRTYYNNANGSSAGSATTTGR